MHKPSVTELLDLLAKPALMEWANKQGLAGKSIKAIRSATKAAGSSMHEQIESGVFTDEALREAHERFMFRKEVIDREQWIETEWFVGRYDARILHNGLVHLIDYKKTSKPRAYFEHKVQLAAYAMGVHADRLAIVTLPACILVPVEVNREACAELMRCLARIHYLRREIEAPHEEHA